MTAREMIQMPVERSKDGSYMTHGHVNGRAYVSEGGTPTDARAWAVIDREIAGRNAKKQAAVGGNS